MESADPKAGKALKSILSTRDRQAPTDNLHYPPVVDMIRQWLALRAAMSERNHAPRLCAGPTRLLQLFVEGISNPVAPFYASPIFPFQPPACSAPPTPAYFTPSGVCTLRPRFTFLVTEQREPKPIEHARYASLNP
jgi:hypothetical protein